MSAAAGSTVLSLFPYTASAQPLVHALTPSIGSAAALMSLKRKKMIESQLEQVENNLQRILEQQMMLEDQRLNMEALLAQQYAAKASKASMKVGWTWAPEPDHTRTHAADQQGRAPFQQGASAINTSVHLMSRMMPAALQHLEAAAQAVCCHCQAFGYTPADQGKWCRT